MDALLHDRLSPGREGALAPDLEPGLRFRDRL